MINLDQKLPHHIRLIGISLVVSQSNYIYSHHYLTAQFMQTLNPSPPQHSTSPSQQQSATTHRQPPPIYITKDQQSTSRNTKEYISKNPIWLTHSHCSKGERHQWVLPSNLQQIEQVQQQKECLRVFLCESGVLQWLECFEMLRQEMMGIYLRVEMEGISNCKLQVMQMVQELKCKMFGMCLGKQNKQNTQHQQRSLDYTQTKELLHQVTSLRKENIQLTRKIEQLKAHTQSHPDHSIIHQHTILDNSISFHSNNTTINSVYLEVESLGVDQQERRDKMRIDQQIQVNQCEDNVSGQGDAKTGVKMMMNSSDWMGCVQKCLVEIKRIFNFYLLAVNLALINQPQLPLFHHITTQIQYHHNQHPTPSIGLLLAHIASISTSLDEIIRQKTPQY